MSARKAPYAAVPVVLMFAVIAVLGYFGTARAKTQPLSPGFDMFIACWHDESSEYHCGGDTSAFMQGRSFETGVPVELSTAAHGPSAVSLVPVIPSDTVDSLVLIAYVRGGEPQRKRFSNKTDAIFLSRYATSEMLRRYYNSRRTNLNLPRRERESARDRSARLLKDLDKYWPARAPK